MSASTFSHIIAAKPSEPSVTLLAAFRPNPITPKRARRWGRSSGKVISRMKKGARTCTLVVGEEAEAKLLVEDHEQVTRFRIELAQRELIVETYRLLGNARSPFSEEDNPAVGRKAFYSEFLTKREDLIHDFIATAVLPAAAAVPFEVKDFLSMISPFEGGTLKVANASAHDISFEDVYLALDLMKQKNAEKAKPWRDLAMLLTDEIDITSWQGKKDLVKEACCAKRDKMRNHRLRVAAKKFEDERKAEDERKFFAKLEQRGLVVSLKTHRDSHNSTDTKFQLITIVLVVIAVHAIRLSSRVSSLGGLGPSR